jgi:hypothetical protein
MCLHEKEELEEEKKNEAYPTKKTEAYDNWWWK